MNRLIFLFLALLASTVVIGANTGCAYRFGDQERDIPGGYRTVAVPVFKNKTMETGIEVFFTNALIREFERSRIGRITDQAQSQTTLEGVIESVEYIPTSEITPSDAGNKSLPQYTVLTTEYRIFVRTRLKLVRNSDKKILWEGSFEGERSYLAPKVGKETINSSNPLYNQSARYQNIQVMAGDIMNEAHNRLTENF